MRLFKRLNNFQVWSHTHLAKLFYDKYFINDLHHCIDGVRHFCFLGYITLWYYWLHKDNRPVKPPLPLVDELPLVTIQLPVFNEQFVIKRLIDAAVNLDYPVDKLHIQVVDDSSDTTHAIAANLVNSISKMGYGLSTSTDKIETDTKLERWMLRLSKQMGSTSHL